MEISTQVAYGSEYTTLPVWWGLDGPACMYCTTRTDETRLSEDDSHDWTCLTCGRTNVMSEATVQLSIREAEEAEGAEPTRPRDCVDAAIDAAREDHAHGH